MFESEDENYLRMAQKELDLGYFESAISFYDKAIKCSPNADNYYLKGLAYYNHCSKNYLAESETSDIKSAIQNFSTAISIAPQTAIYYYYGAKANLKCIQNYDYIEVEGERERGDWTHDYKLKRDALSFILADLQKAMSLDSAYEEEYKRFYNSNVEQKYVLEDSSIPKKYQLNLNKDSNSELSENEIKEPLKQEKILSANSDEVKELNKNPNNNGYKILKYNEDTGICIIRDKYLNYGLSDKDLNIILPTEYMNISFCKDGDTNILLQKKDENGTPKYGIANKEGKIIIEPIYGSIKYDKTKDKYVLISDTFNPDEKILADIKTGLTANSQIMRNTTKVEIINNEYYNKGIEYLNTKDYKNAYKCFEQALDIEQNNEYYKVLQLQCKYEYIQNEESIEKKFVEEFIQECYNFLGNSSENYKISVYFWLGVALYFLSQYDDATKNFDKVVQKEQNAQAFYYLGCIYLVKSRYNKALEYCDKAIAIDPNDIKLYRMRSKTKLYLNVPIEESLKDCYKAYELDNNYSLAIENIILYLLLSDDNYKALHYCDELIEKDSDRAEEAYLLKSIINFQLNNIEAALMNFKMGYEWYNEIVDYHKRMLDDLTNHANIVEEKFYINEKIEKISPILNILQTLNQELQKTVKICSFCGKLEDENRFIINKDDECICNECLALCNEILEEDCLNTNYKTVQHSKNANGEITCSYCGRTNEEVDKIIHADSHYICNGCVGILNKVCKNKSDFDTEYKKTIEEMKENHGSFYSTDEKSDSNYLKDKMLYMYGKELAYKYLVKAAHVLKKHNCNKKDRQKILKYLYGCSEYYIDSALQVEFDFKKPEMERLLTVGMEVAFHRIVVMYKNNILNNPTMAEDIIDTFASIVCAVELNYIKDKDKLKDEYYIANTIYFRELKEHLKEWLDEGKITKEQYNHALDKSGLVYLTPEITRLMKSGSFKFSKMGYMILFIVVWVIFKLIIFYTKHH